MNLWNYVTYVILIVAVRSFLKHSVVQLIVADVVTRFLLGHCTIYKQLLLCTAKLAPRLSADAATLTNLMAWPQSPCDSGWSKLGIHRENGYMHPSIAVPQQTCLPISSSNSRSVVLMSCPRRMSFLLNQTKIASLYSSHETVFIMITAITSARITGRGRKCPHCGWLFSLLLMFLFGEQLFLAVQVRTYE